MTVTTVSLPQPVNDGANTAAIVSWGSRISSMFSGAGLVQSSDTGQINWGTASPTYLSGGTTQTNMGVEIWKFNDSLQATKPVYIRVEYWQVRTGGSSNYFYLNIAVGVGTNGASGLSGLNTGTAPISDRTDVSSSATAYPGALNNPTVSSFSSGDGSSIALALAPFNSAATTSNSCGSGVFFVDRTRDGSGAITGEGAVAGWIGWGSATASSTNSSGNGNTSFFNVLSFTTVALVGLGTAGAGVLLPAAIAGQMSTGTQISLYAPPTYANHKILPPVLVAQAYHTSDMPANQQLTVSISNANHTYLTMGPNFSQCDRSPANTNACLALRYE